MANPYTILAFGDTHEPYSHPDAFDFIKEVKAKFNPDRVFHLGDELDQQSVNFHMRNPNLKGHKDETNDAKSNMQRWFFLFPEMKVCNSNHTSLVIRNSRKAGISDQWIKTIGEVLEAPNGWTWHNKIEFNYTSLRQESQKKILIQHHLSKNSLAIAKKFGCCFIQGHFHSNFGVQWFNTPNGQVWSLDVGCLIDNTHDAFDYNKTNKEIPFYGCGVVVGGIPIAVPMLTDRHDRWVGKIIIKE